MKKRKKLILMSTALFPLVGVACYLIAIQQAIWGAVLFCVAVTFGNWFTWYNFFRKPKGEARA